MVFLPSDLIGGLEDTYERLDFALYPPLCVALAARTARGLTHGTGRVRGHRVGSVGARAQP